MLGYGQVAGPDASLLLQPANATRQALQKAGRPPADVDLFEINEAFAVVGLASMADLGITDEITNVNGGAIALGHPIGMSGTRLALTVLHELSGAAVASERSACAAAAARVTPWSSGPSPDRPSPRVAAPAGPVSGRHTSVLSIEHMIGRPVVAPVHGEPRQ